MDGRPRGGVERVEMVVGWTAGSRCGQVERMANHNQTISSVTCVPISMFTLLFDNIAVSTYKDLRPMVIFS